MNIDDELKKAQMKVDLKEALKDACEFQDVAFESIVKTLQSKAKLTRIFYLNLRKEGFNRFEALAIVAFRGV